MARKRKRQPIDQQRLALSYGALRNALGNYGRLGTDVLLLTPPPILTTGIPSSLTIKGLPTPPDATEVKLFDSAGHVLGLPHAVDASGRLIVTPLPGPVAWVEVYRKKTPILLGIPIS
jgi:hypothetical protein